MAQQPAGTPNRPNVVDMSGAPAAAAVTGAKVLMLRTFVSDLDRSSKFYNEVFGMTTVSLPPFAGRQGAAPGAASPQAGARAQAAPASLTGGGIRILNFPGGSPGMILIKGSGGPDMLRGSYIIQVPDLAAALAAAEANGGKVQATRFVAGAQESRHVLDPDGNDLEILQSGARAKQ
jgi:predicted enzyme related to lactoylglutathione lyase